MVPVEVYVRGCLPRTDACGEGRRRVQTAIRSERRRLSWVAGSQETYRPPLPSLRDLNRKERQRATVLRGNDEV